METSISTRVKPRDLLRDDLLGLLMCDDLQRLLLCHMGHSIDEYVEIG